MREENDGEVDLRLWGKSRGLGDDQRYPLACHLLDAGAAARCLWDSYLPPGLKRFIAEGFGVTADHAGDLIALWAALHDIGKLTAEFQSQDPDADLSGYPAGRGQKPEHDLAGQKWLQTALPGLDYATGDRYSPGFSVPQLLGGHHGTFHPGLDAGSSRPRLSGAGFHDDAWEHQRRATLSKVRRILGSPGPPPDSSPQAAVLACAVIVLADWLVSQEAHLLSRMGGLPASGTEAELREHFRRSLVVCADLVSKAGLIQLRLRPGSFSESFPRIENPNALQRSVAERLPGLVTGPGLLLITAPPGHGKTETALFGAKVMGEMTGRPGVYMALPTTATADQIYGRIRRFLESQAETPSSLMLLHGMAWLNTRYMPEAEPGQVLAEDPFTAADWLLGRWRGMCGSWGVGTIDQALMAVLTSRHNALRLFGLAGKTVIVDEVHACDPYMQGLLLRLLRWLGSFGTPVVLLSATLTTGAADALVTAYLEGADPRHRARHRPERSVAPGYPGWLYADAVTGSITATPVSPPPAPPLEVGVREITASSRPGDGREVPDRGPALRTELAPLTESGGCALVICTTVDEAQHTYCQLRDWFAEIAAAGQFPPRLDLLHARYPAWQREEITRRVMARYGKNEKDADGKDLRPPSAVLVATAIVEQSLDLDFDLIVSDLAPVALLLQRAGRCWRHQALGTIPRPSWADGPRLTVLVPPGGPESPQLFPSWKAIYDESLLTGTYRLLAVRHEIRIPEDVQQLVDAVYDDPALVTGLDSAVAARLGDEIARKELAKLVSIPGPHAIDWLVPLTASDVDPEMLATRFDADSVRALPVFTSGDGRYWLNRACTAELPGQDDTPHLAACREIIRHTVPVRGGPWLGEPDARPSLPAPWRQNVHLRDIVLLVHSRDPDGGYGPAAIGDREFFLDSVLGLQALHRNP